MAYFSLQIIELLEESWDMAYDTGPNEVQGSSIKGGVKHDIGPGDVIEIPAGVPHQFFVAPGTSITYLVVKVVKR